MNERILKLKNLYKDSSKHSTYQNIPSFVQEALGYQEHINEEWRGDTARYKFILGFLQELKVDSIVDIGANTGFFSHSLMKDLPNISVTAIEPNKNHAEFIREINEIFNLTNIKVIDKPLQIENFDALQNEFDCALILNVLHHAGVDFDQDKVKEPYEVWDYMENYLNKFSKVSSLIILQLGYNWGGDKTKPIVPTSDCYRMFSNLYNSAKRSGWNIREAAYYFKREQEYKTMPQSILDTIDNDESKSRDLFNSWYLSMDISTSSEFYKRPLLILENSAN
ncbi:class I SAM-dependent methyltransferase [Paenibacillus lautus]